MFRAGCAMAEFQRDWDVLLSSVLGSPPFKLGILTLGDLKAFGEAAQRFVPFQPRLYMHRTKPSMSVPLHGRAPGCRWRDVHGRYGEDATCCAWRRSSSRRGPGPAAAEAVRSWLG